MAAGGVGELLGGRHSSQQACVWIAPIPTYIIVEKALGSQ